MKFPSELAICLVASFAAHAGIVRVLEGLPEHHDRPVPRKIDIQVIPAPEVPPPPEPEKPPDPEPPPPREVHEAPKARPVHAPMVAAVAKDAPAPDHPAVTVDSTETPVFGVTMESTSSAGGPAVPIGNDTRTPAAGPGSAAKPLAAPVAAFEATKMPLPQARCFGKYTDEARAAGTEGTVVLDLDRRRRWPRARRPRRRGARERADRGRCQGRARVPVLARREGWQGGRGPRPWVQIRFVLAEAS